MELVDLPLDALMRILMFLKFGDLVSASATCRTLRHVAQADVIWMNLCTPWASNVPLQDWLTSLDSPRALYRLLRNLSPLVGSWVAKELSPRGGFVHVVWGKLSVVAYRIFSPLSVPESRKLFQVAGFADGTDRVELFAGLEQSTEALLPAALFWESPDRGDFHLATYEPQDKVVAASALRRSVAQMMTEGHQRRLRSRLYQQQLLRNMWLMQEGDEPTLQLPLPLRRAHIDAPAVPAAAVDAGEEPIRAAAVRGENLRLRAVQYLLRVTGVGGQGRGGGGGGGDGPLDDAALQVGADGAGGEAAAALPEAASPTPPRPPSRLRIERKQAYGLCTHVGVNGSRLYFRRFGGLGFDVAAQDPAAAAAEAPPGGDAAAEGGQRARPVSMISASRYERLEVPAPGPGRELAGLWCGTYGPHGMEILFVDYTPEGEIVGTKILGDPNVPCREVSFKATVASMREHESAPADPAVLLATHQDDAHDPPVVVRTYEGMGRIADHNFRHPQWVPGQLLVGRSGSDSIWFRWDDVNFVIRFRRLSLPAVIPSTSAATAAAPRAAS